MLPLLLFFFSLFDDYVWAAKHFSVLGIEVVLCWVSVEYLHLQSDCNWSF